MAIDVLCDQCCKLQHFDDGERGSAWLSVIVIDGDDKQDGDGHFLLSCHFCCPKCASDFLNDPEQVGTIRFGEPLQ